jgi:hypothetical protein
MLPIPVAQLRIRLVVRLVPASLPLGGPPGHPGGWRRGTLPGPSVPAGLSAGHEASYEGLPPQCVAQTTQQNALARLPGAGRLCVDAAPRAGPGRAAPRGSAIRRARPRRPRAWRGRAHLDVPVTVGSPLTSGRAARIRSASAKCSPAAVGIRGVLVTCARFDREWIGERPSLRCVPVEDLSGELTGMRVSNGCVLPRTRAYRHDSARVGFG